jgi:hypothetical protein
MIGSAGRHHRPVGFCRNAPILGNAVTIEAVDRYCRQIHWTAIFASRKTQPHRDLVALFDHVEDIDPSSRDELSERSQHVPGAIMTRPKATERRIMQLEVFGEPFGDMTNVSGGHRSRELEEEVFPSVVHLKFA